MIKNSFLNRVLFFLSFFSFVAGSNAQDNLIPERPDPPRLVNVFSKQSFDFLSASDLQALESKLSEFNNQTSNQFCVVITDDLHGMDANSFATGILRKWQVGQKKLNNGVVFLVKPKTSDSRGEVYIATGYGLEGAIPDITCRKIEQTEVIPRFKKGDYIGGITAGVNVLMELAKGEYNSNEYAKRTKSGKESSRYLPFLIIILVAFFIFMRSGGRGGGMGTAFWIGSGGFGGGFGGGGGGGGFGGFGGGGGGGGGAGGSW